MNSRGGFRSDSLKRAPITMVKMNTVVKLNKETKKCRRLILRQVKISRGITQFKISEQQARFDEPHWG
jgi:hypothetical protein